MATSCSGNSPHITSSHAGSAVRSFQTLLPIDINDDEITRMGFMSLRQQMQLSLFLVFILEGEGIVFVSLLALHRATEPQQKHTQA